MDSEVLCTVGCHYFARVQSYEGMKSLIINNMAATSDTLIHISVTSVTEADNFCISLGDREE